MARKWYIESDNSGNPSPEEVKAALMNGAADPAAEYAPEPTPHARITGRNVFHMTPSTYPVTEIRRITQADERCETCGRITECCCPKEPPKVHAQRVRQADPPYGSDW